MAIDAADSEVLRQSDRWLAAGQQVDLVTVVNTWGSSPRPVGSIAAVRDDGVLVGSVSGGCVEKQLSESMRKTRRFGLACGGSLELVFEHLQQRDSIAQVLQLLDQRKRVARIVDLHSMRCDVVPAAPTRRFSYSEHQLVQVFGPAWRALLIGAGQLSRFTAEFAQALEFEVIVCDPRMHFRSAWSVDSVTVIDMSPDDAVTKYAHDVNSAVPTLSHDPNLDDLALLEALPSDAFYVGALGSKGSHKKRVSRLIALGAQAQDIDRLQAPIGIKISSRTSAEIAVSIAAQLVQARAEQLSNVPQSS